MKMRLEKPTVNISKLTGGKNEKPRRGTLHEKRWLDLYFVYSKHWMEIKNKWICDMSTRGSLIDILLHVHNEQQTEVIFGFLLTFITPKLREHLVGVFTAS